MKSIYISGCFGFMGSYLTRSMLKLGWQVYGIDLCTSVCRREELEKEFNQYTNFKWEKKDIVDIKTLFDCDYFINTAASSHVGNSIVNSDDFIHSNIKGVHSILEAIRKSPAEGHGKPIIIQFSTDEVYSDVKNEKSVETDLLCPANPYSSSKAAADMLILAWARTYNLNYIIIRFNNNFGIGQYIEKLIPKSVKYLQLERKIPLHNEGKPLRTFLHAQDSADAVIHIINKEFKNEIFNVAGDYEDSNINVVKKIINEFYKREEDCNKYVDFSYNRPGQDLRYHISDEKLRKTGWFPQKTFDKEIPAIVEYYKNNFIW